MADIDKNMLGAESIKKYGVIINPMSCEEVSH